MRTNNKFWYCLFTILCAMLLTTTVQAQVTIGEEADPQPFSMLELISNGTGGLRLPQLTTDQRDALTATDAFQSQKTNKGRGLMIYNTTIHCVEYWNASRWVGLCELIPPTITVTGVTLLGCPSANLTVGSTVQLTASVVPSNATNKTITYSDSNNGFATVDESGLVTALVAGTEIITATSADGGKTATCNITVVDNCTPPAITGGTPAGSTIDLTEGQTLTLNVNTTGTSPTYQWYKDNNLIPGATNETYTKSNVTKSDAGTYKVIVAGSGSCASQTAMVDNITVIVNPNPENLTPGAGTVTGRYCFDINKSNFEGACGSENGRTPQMVDFASLGAVTYTFTASSSETKSNLRFMIVDAEGCVASSTAATSGISGTISNNQVVTFTVTYQDDMSLQNPTKGPQIWGRTADLAAKVKLYAVYNDGLQDVAVPLIVSIQDCTCACLVKTGPDQYITLRCHNLGADETADWHVPQKALNGNYYQWGRTAPVATVDAPIGTWSPSPSDGVNDPVWTDSEPDPCTAELGAGWRIPTRPEWKLIIDNNTFNNTGSFAGGGNFTSGKFITPSSTSTVTAFLPVAGYMYSGVFEDRGKYGYYWSSSSPGEANKPKCYSFILDTSGQYEYGFGSKSMGHSVRCISE